MTGALHTSKVVPCIVYCALRYNQWLLLMDRGADSERRLWCKRVSTSCLSHSGKTHSSSAQLTQQQRRQQLCQYFSLSGTQDPWWMFNRTWLGRCQQAPPGQQHTFAAPFPKLEKPSAGTQGKLCDNWILPANSQTGCDRHNAHFGKLINLEDLNVAANYRTGFATLLPRPSRTGLTTCCLPLKVK